MSRMKPLEQKQPGTQLAVQTKGGDRPQIAGQDEPQLSKDSFLLHLVLEPPQAVLGTQGPSLVSRM